MTIASKCANCEKVPGWCKECTKARIAKFRKYAVIVGIVLAIACKSLPPDYQATCKAIANICTGAFLTD